jgi:ATP-dependent protease ClpP protease subunit
MIFLAADSYEISDHSVFMFHDYSGGTFGKGGEMYDQITHERKWTENLLHDVYKEFMTKEEIESLIKGKDMWMTAKEVSTRLKKIDQLEEEKEKRKSGARKTK